MLSGAIDLILIENLLAGIGVLSTSKYKGGVVGAVERVSNAG